MEPMQTQTSLQRPMPGIPLSAPAQCGMPQALTPAKEQAIQARAQQATQSPEQRQLLIEGWTQAQSKGDATLATQTDQLAQLYHDREVLQLSRSLGVTDAANDQPPAGWIEASQPTEAVLAQYGVSNREELLAQFGLSLSELHPNDGAGFNAELYLPDPAVYGADAKPVLAFEGTDFSDPDDVNADVAQAMGHPDEYYNRAMNLSQQVNEHTGGHFEITGHSLGGGLATAGGLVTGATTIVSNPAGVHADTIARFTSERGLSAQGDEAVRTYAVDGDILTELQAATSGLSADNADGLAAIFNGVLIGYNKLNGSQLPTDTTGAQLRETPDAAGTVTTLPAVGADGTARPQITGMKQILDNIQAKADVLSLPGEVVERAGGVVGWFGDRVNDVTDAIGGVTSWIDDNVPGWQADLIGSAGQGVKTFGDVIDNVGEFARSSGQTVADVNRTVAVGVASLLETASGVGSKDAPLGEVIPSFQEMAQRHEASVAYEAMDHHIGVQESALRESLGN